MSSTPSYLVVVPERHTDTVGVDRQQHLPGCQASVSVVGTARRHSKVNSQNNKLEGTFTMCRPFFPLHPPTDRPRTGARGTYVRTGLGAACTRRDRATSFLGRNQREWPRPRTGGTAAFFSLPAARGPPRVALPRDGPCQSGRCMCLLLLRTEQKHLQKMGVRLRERSKGRTHGSSVRRKLM